MNDTEMLNYIKEFSPDKEFTGFQLAQAIQSKTKSRFMISYGTLYRYLDKLEDDGMITARWEETETKEVPRRKYYSLRKHS